MQTQFRCNCPVTSALDILGDKWSLVIVKSMLMEGKQTFKDFTEADEGVATNILSDRLKRLEEFGIISKNKLPNNKKTNIYTLSQKGLDLTPVIIELILWSDTYARPYHPEMIHNETLNAIKQDKNMVIQEMKKQYQKYIN